MSSGRAHNPAKRRSLEVEGTTETSWWEMRSKYRDSCTSPSRTRAFTPISRGDGSRVLFLWPQELACHLHQTSHLPLPPRSPVTISPSALISYASTKHFQGFLGFLTACDIKGKLTDPIKNKLMQKCHRHLGPKGLESSTFRGKSRQLWQMLPPRSWDRSLAEGQPEHLGVDG